MISPVFAELTSSGVLEVRCERGHVTYAMLQHHRFEVLLEFGGLALLDGYYREAISNFAACWERFGSFYIDVVCEARQIDPSNYKLTWKLVAKRSERQFGAFAFVHLLETGSPPPEGGDVKLRNDVVHDGYLPSREETLEFGRRTFDGIVLAANHLRANLGEAATKVRVRHLARQAEEVRQLGTSAATHFAQMILSWESDHGWSRGNFESELESLRQRREFMWARPIDGA